MMQYVTEKQYSTIDDKHNRPVEQQQYYGGPATIVQYSKSNKKQQKAPESTKNFVKQRKSSLDELNIMRDNQ